MSNNSKPVELLQVFFNTKGDYFTPKPVPLNRYLFTTKVFLNASILNGNKVDLKKMFMDPYVFDNALKLLKSEEYSTYTPEEIKKNNIEVFRKTFLAKKTQIPVGSRTMTIVSSNYVPDSFILLGKGTGSRDTRNIQEYTLLYDVYVLTKQGAVSEEEFKSANCKVQAKELNKQAFDIFGISLGLDSIFTPVEQKSPTNYNINPYGRSSSTPYGSSAYGSTPYGSSSYGSTPYGSSSYGSRSSSLYGSSPYGSNPYGSSSYGSSPYGSSAYGNNPYSNNPYASSAYGSRISNPYGSLSNNPYGTLSRGLSNTSELSTARKEIETLLLDTEKEEETKRKERYKTDWLIYKEDRENEDLRYDTLADWNKKKEQSFFERKYNKDWLNYKTTHSQGDFEKWLKGKLEEERVKESDYYAKEWLDYKKDQALSGKKPVLTEWVKERQRKNKLRQEQLYGGKVKGKRKRSKNSKKKVNKRTVRRSIKRKRNKL